MDIALRASLAFAGLSLCACAAPETRPDPGPGAVPAPPVSEAAPPTAAPRAPVSPAPPQDLRSRLRSQSVGKLVFTEETGDYREVARTIQAVTGIPILVTPSGREVIDAEGLVVVLELVAPISVENLLNFMTSRSDNLTWVVREGVVMLTSTADTGDENTLVVYDVRDLTFPITSFLPPEINTIPGEDVELRNTPRTGGEAEDKVSRVQPDLLVEVVKDATDPAYWSGDTGATIEYLDTGYLVVNANRDMHRRIAGFLGSGR